MALPCVGVGPEAAARQPHCLCRFGIQGFIGLGGGYRGLGLGGLGFRVFGILVLKTLIGSLGGGSGLFGRHKLSP